MYKKRKRYGYVYIIKLEMRNVEYEIKQMSREEKIALVNYPSLTEGACDGGSNVDRQVD